MQERKVGKYQINSAIRFYLILTYQKKITKFDFKLDKLYALCIKLSVDSFIYSFKITYWLTIVPNT